LSALAADRPPDAAGRVASPQDIRISCALQKSIELLCFYVLGKWHSVLRNEGERADQYTRWIEAFALPGDYEGRKNPELGRVRNGFLGFQQPEGMNKRTPKES